MTHSAALGLALIPAVFALNTRPRVQQVGPRCYRTTVGDWSWPFPSGARHEHRVPLLVRLDTTSLDTVGVWHALWPSRRPRANRRLLPAGWRRVGSEVELLWSNGFAGVRVRARSITPDSLDGIAQSFYDVIDPSRPEPTAPFAAGSVSCAGIDSVDTTGLSGQGDR